MSSPVSVVIPTAPDNPFLGETLRSVAEQTASDWEVVVALDGESGANRAAIRAALPAEKVRVVSTPAARSGPAVARNVGVRASSHPIIAFLDADDLCAPERLARQSAALAAQPKIGLIGSWAAKFTGEGNPAGSLRSPTGAEQVGRTMLLFNCLVTSTIAVRREVLAEVGEFDPRCVRLEDYDLWLRVLARYDIDVLGEELLRYRVHENQYSRGRILGRQTRLLAASRRAAASRLGVSGVASGARHTAWLGVQLVRRRW